MSLKDSFQKKKVLNHLAIIMDGNSRWSAKAKVDITEGYAQGAEALHKTIEYAMEYHIPYLTVYAFSTENWNRSQEEISGIMDLFKDLLLSKERFFVEHGVRFNMIGDNIKSSKYLELAQSMDRLKKITSQNDNLLLTIAFNYGGKQEICEAVRQVSKKILEQQLKPEELSLEILEKHLYTSGIPPVDLLIRTSGEYRISNFLLWQAAYAEFIFIDTLWPDFDREDFERAMEEFLKRHRRFGSIHSS